MKRIIFGLIIVVIIGLVAFRIFDKKEKISEKKTQQALPVEVVRAKSGDISEILSLSGTIKSDNEIKVFPKAAGKIEKIYVKEGDYVAKGQIIAQIERDVLQKQVDAIKNGLNAARVGYQTAKSPLRKQELENLDSGIEAAKTGLILAENNYTRMKNLYESGSISRVMLEQAELQYIQAKTGYENLIRQRQMLVEEGGRDVEKESAKAQISSLEAQLKQAEDALRDTTVFSPISGWITNKFFNEGEVFSPAGGLPLVIIVDNRDIYLDVQVGEKDIGKIKQGQYVEITLDAIQDKIYSGKVAKINQQVVSFSRSSTIKIDILNNDGRIKSGMFGRCKIEVAKHKNAILIPKDCIKKKNEKEVVFVVEKNVAKEKEVKVGIINTDVAEILQGLKEDELVVISGQDILRDGDKVKIVN